MKRKARFACPARSRQPYYLTTQAGLVQRRVLPAVPVGKQVLIGIIEGPPPFSAMNLSLPNGAAAISKVPSSVSNTENASVSTSFTNTNISKYDGKLLIGGVGPVFDDEDTNATTQLTDHAATTSMTYSYEQHLNVDRTTAAPYQARPEMTLVLLGNAWGGYAYEVVDEQKNRIPGTAAFAEFFPLPQSTRMATVYMNPNGLRVGDLNSYVRTESEIKNFDNRSMISGLNNQRYIEFAWSPGE